MTRTDAPGTDALDSRTSAGTSGWWSRCESYARWACATLAGQPEGAVLRYLGVRRRGSKDRRRSPARWRSAQTSAAISGSGMLAAVAAPAPPSCLDMAAAATTSATSFASQSRTHRRVSSDLSTSNVERRQPRPNKASRMPTVRAKRMKGPLGLSSRWDARRNGPTPSAKAVPIVIRATAEARTRRTAFTARTIPTRSRPLGAGLKLVATPSPLWILLASWR